METLSTEQEEVLIGGLLGDSCLFTQKSAVNPLLTITRSSKDLQYLEYQFDIFKDFCKQGITTHTKIINGYDKIYNLSRFRTRHLVVLRQYKEKWYPDGKKIIPRDLKLTPLIVAIWFCDDGCISVKKDKKGNPSNALKLKLATHGFSKEDVIFLANALSTLLNTNFNVNEYKGKFYIQAYTEATKKFTEYILGVFPKSMIRKLKHLEN